MQYDLVIKRTLREAQGILWANLPPASNLPDAQAVKSLRALVRTPQVHQALERGNDTALCFVLRAVNRILSDEDQPNTTINQLWDVLDQPELNRARSAQRKCNRRSARCCKALSLCRSTSISACSRQSRLEQSYSKRTTKEGNCNHSAIMF